MDLSLQVNIVQQQSWNEIIPCGWDKSPAGYQQELKLQQ